ncbi:hypothetical protein [Chelativorans sp.]|uniref:hypothetical protein n=1 Tax=Chelativorans sp. TaxID=2203393 RepID=UPI002811F4EF|nr:hypothetical protein [Chelativorans sp.]
MRIVIAVTALLALVSKVTNPAIAQGEMNGTTRFGGTAQILSLPPLPLHVELHQSDEAVTGRLSIPDATFELLEAQGGDTIVGRFRGVGGSGVVFLRIDGSTLTGTFDLDGAPGTISARLTTVDAKTFFAAPEQNLTISSAQWLEDLDRLAAILRSKHGSPFHRISRKEFERELERVRNAIPRLSGVQVALEFRKLGALIGDGHTAVALPSGTVRLPVEFYWFEDGVRIVGISAPHQSLLGSRLIAVNGVPIAQVIERMRAFIPQGETRQHVRAEIPGLLSNPEILEGVRAGGTGPVRLTLEKPGGTSTRLQLKPQVKLLATPQPRLPLWRRNAGQGFWTEGLADGSVYVNWRSYGNLASEAEALLRGLDGEHPRRLIIDLRDNSGGDYSKGRAFIDQIARRPWLNRRGVLYVIIGRSTFSAAMTNAVDFMRTTNALLVGEAAGAAPNNWQEVRRFHLPNSGLGVSVSTRYYEFLPGKEKVRPDLAAPPELEDWGAAADAGLRRILSQPVP